MGSVQFGTNLKICPAPPEPGEYFRQFSDRDIALRVRTEIPGLRDALLSPVYLLGRQQISTNRLKHVLPGTHAIGPTNDAGLVGSKGFGHVRHKSVKRPVPPTYDVTSANCC